MNFIAKKLTVLVLVMIAFLSSCQKNDPVQNYTNYYAQDYTVKQGDWKKGSDDKSGMYYYCVFQESNLTQYIYNNGVMQAFLYTNNGNISPLPFNDYWIEDTTGYMYTEQITCEFVPGYITFIVKASDHNENFLPSYSEYDFTVRLMW